MTFSRSRNYFPSEPSILIALMMLVFPCHAFSSTYEISGVVEAELGTGDSFDGESSSDITLATIEISIDAEISERFSGHIVMLYEEDQTPIEIDQGIITYGNSFLSSFSIHMGQQYLPFGMYDTNLTSDPLTLELGETRESALVFSYDGKLYASFYLFNGSISETGKDDSIDSMGANLGFSYEGDSISFDTGIGYISNIKDSDGLTDNIVSYRDDINEEIPTAFPTPEEVSEHTAGFSGHLTITWGTLTLIAEVVAAIDDFAADEIAASKKKPSAGNVEIAYSISDNLTIAFASQNTVDLAGYLPESRSLLGLTYSIDEATSFAIEFASDSDYELVDGGTGKTASTTTLQFATQF